MNDKITEKAVWDELVPSDDEKIASASFGQPAQAQMMFCYKCNQVIPANSAFCPWCQTELFVTCPKCGNKYSSQYPACNQCGTNLKVYITRILPQCSQMIIFLLEAMSISLCGAIVLKHPPHESPLNTDTTAR